VRAYLQLIAACLMSGLLLMAAVPASAQSFVAPPRTITDITAILDQEKPDPSAIAKMRVEAEASPPATAARSQRAEFHYKRCMVRSRLGEFRDAIADCEQAVEYAQGSVDLLVCYWREPGPSRESGRGWQQQLGGWGAVQ
jgi:hypothetical protein